ncbi:MAG: hypothetical protein AABW99_01250 [archaeon]
MPGKFHPLRLVRKKRILKLRASAARKNTLRQIRKANARAARVSKMLKLQGITEDTSYLGNIKALREIARQLGTRQRQNLWPKRKIKTRQ